MSKVRLSKSNCSWLVIALLYLTLFTGLVIAGRTRTKPQDTPNSTKSDAIEYRVGRRASITENSKTVLLVLVSIEPKHFVREDMLKLAQQLKRDFETEPRVRVDIFDDHSAASVWDPVHFYELYQAARRGSYYRDVKAGKEYVEFSVARGKRKMKITLDK